MAEIINDESAVDPTASPSDETPGPSADNRRNHVRVRPDKTNQLAATLASGSDIKLIDLSKGGAQFECDRRFLPNATVSLRLLTRDGEVLVTGRVVRSRIVRLGSGGLGYLVAVAFAKPLQTELAAGPPTAAPSAPAPAVPGTPAAPVAVAPPAPPAAEPPDASPAESSAVVLDTATEDSTAAPAPPQADITAEEALAFEATTEIAPATLTVTASVNTTSEQLHDMFDGNDW